MKSASMNSPVISGNMKNCSHVSNFVSVRPVIDMKNNSSPTKLIMTPEYTPASVSLSVLSRDTKNRIIPIAARSEITTIPFISMLKFAHHTSGLSIASTLRIPERLYVPFSIIWFVIFFCLNILKTLLFRQQR